MASTVDPPRALHPGRRQTGSSHGLRARITDRSLDRGPEPVNAGGRPAGRGPGRPRTRPGSGRGQDLGGRTVGHEPAPVEEHEPREEVARRGRGRGGRPATVTPSRSLRSTSSSITSTWWRRSRWTVGSSRTRSGAAWATAMASRTSWRSPSDSSRASRPTQVADADPVDRRRDGRTVRRPQAAERVLVRQPAERRRPPRRAIANGRRAWLRHDRDAGGRLHRGRASRAARRRSATVPGVGATSPVDRAQQRRLAGAVRSEERDPLAGARSRGRRRWRTRRARPYDRAATVVARSSGATGSPLTARSPPRPAQEDEEERRADDAP